PDLIELGVDAVNSQLFCMDMHQIAERAKGKITFWGEIDRQHVLPEAPEKGREAVRQVVHHLYDPRGGVIAQMEFGPGANPATVMAVYDEWEKLTDLG
ncbi:MAG: methyltransferase, partial [Hyphomonadaceae bacterium]|nr:methyltransferase [Hyphomonadaceae bacterium]